MIGWYPGSFVPPGVRMHWRRYASSASTLWPSASCTWWPKSPCSEGPRPRPSVIALPSTGELTVFTPSDKAYTEVAKIKVADTPTYAHPVIAGNKIFIRDQNSVALLTVG